MKTNYIFIPLSTLAVSVGGSFLTDSGMEWYDTLKLPSFTPPGSVIGMVWTFIFILSTISALILWNKASRGARFNAIFALFICNALLNFFWSFLFFYQGLIGASIWEMCALNLTTLSLIVLSWKFSRTAALLLTPYFAWVSFATYLAYQIWKLNM